VICWFFGRYIGSAMIFTRIEIGKI